MRLLSVLVIAAAITGCAARGAIPAPFPRPADDSSISPSPSPLPGEHRASVIGTALSLRGVPYRNGGSDPSGFDCSGFVAYVFAQQGYSVPRTVFEQSHLGERVERGGLIPGDLVFFSTVAPGPSHVGIAISPSEFVHAPSSSGVVRVEDLAAPYWESRFVAARRLFAP
jgi:cell wall-associated NlpC family hydrolase